MKPWEKYKKQKPWEKYALARGRDSKESPPPQVSPDSFDVGVKSSPYKTAGGVVPTPLKPDDDTVERFWEGLSTNKPARGIAGEVGRILPATVGGIAGAGGGTVLGAGVGAIPGAGIGGAAGESARQALVNARALVSGGEMASPGEALGNVAASGLAQGAGVVGGKVAGAALSKSKEFIKWATKGAMKGIGGISDAATERILERPIEVFKAINLDPETAPRWALVFKKSIEAHIEKAGQAYHDLIEGIVRSSKKYGPGFKMNLQDGIGDDLAKIGNESGFSKAGRLVEAEDSKKFMMVLRRANELKDASPEDVYFFQRDLNALSRDAKGTSLGVALGKVARATRKYLAKSIPEIREANKIYAEAMSVSDEAANLLSADNLTSKAASAFKNRTATRDKLLEIATKVPRAKRALEGMLDAKAGLEFAPKIRNIPQTGFLPTAAIGSAMAVSAHPLVSIPMSPLLAFLSPRLTGHGIVAASKVSGALAPMFPYVEKGLSPAFQAALQAASSRGRYGR